MEKKIKDYSKKKKSGNLKKKAAEIETELVMLVKDTFNKLFGKQVKYPNPFSIELKIPINTDGTWKISSQTGILEQIRKSVQDAGSKAECFSPGRVYCYLCNSVKCSHTIPPDPKFVFKNYSPSGTPQWAEFAQYLLDQDDNRAYELYNNSQKILAHLNFGRDLKNKQLHLFGKASKSYDILCQITSGYFNSVKYHEKDKSFALTLQAVESRKKSGLPRLALNIITEQLSKMPVNEFFENFLNEDLKNAIKKTEMKIASLQDRLNVPKEFLTSKKRTRILSQIPGIMRELAGKIERQTRISERRTRHVQVRRLEKRPTSNAIDDAKAAADEKFLYDKKTDTIIVLGRKNRVHVFNQNGVHITSLAIEKKSIAQRIKKERWEPLSARMRENFKKSILQLSK
jgi:hypothetical protein